RRGLLASALEDCNAAVRLATTRKDAESATFARTRGEEIYPRVPRIQLELPAGRTLTRVTLDGKDVSLDPSGKAVLADPGAHKIVVYLSGGDQRTFDVNLKGDVKVTVAAVPEDAALPQATPDKPRAGTERETPPTPEAPLGQSRHSARRTAGMVVGGVGAA